jgi:hypothetical protein
VLSSHPFRFNLTMQKLLFFLLLAPVVAFVSQQTPQRAARASSSSLFAEEDEKKGGIFGGISNFFEELDAFVDDATSRRLGAGAAFYGKRKSSFYGKNDKMKKLDKNTFDPEEDYRGPTSTGLFKWMPDEDGVMRPVTRMKNKLLEKK